MTKDCSWITMLSYCGLIDAKIRASDKDLPVTLLIIRICMRKYNLLGTPETKRKGLRTRNALNALTSKPSICRVDRIVDTTLKKVKRKTNN